MSNEALIKIFFMLGYLMPSIITLVLALDARARAKKARANSLDTDVPAIYNKCVFIALFFVFFSLTTHSLFNNYS